MIKERQVLDTEGAGGSGKSGGGGGSDAPDTLIVDEIVKLMHAVGEGELNLYTGDGQSIYLNNIPLQNSDGTYNFGGYDEATGDTAIYTGGGTTYWEYRSGLPSQAAMTNPAFPSAAAIYSVGAEAFGGTTSPLVPPSPVIYSVTSTDINYAKVAISFPNGIQNVDSNGNIVGDSVEIALDVKEHSSSTWINVLDTVISAKSSEEAIIQFQVNQPVANQLWDIQFRRITQDNATTTRANQCYLYDVEEVQQITLSYNGIALVGLALDAATIGGSYASIPTMSFLLEGLSVQIPSNYNPVTRVYDGTWDGTFTTGVTSNPSWILYDMLTNAAYGGGLYGITPAMVDAYSFYDAGVFCDGGIEFTSGGDYVSGGVPDGNGGYEARFTWNAVIQNRQDMLTSFQQVADMFNSSLGMENGLITVYQDTPGGSQYLVTKANCIGSDDTAPVYFTYSSSAWTTRTTAINVTWTNPTNVAYLPTETSVSDTDGVTRYGYQSSDLAALGATTQGQAIRYAKYKLYRGLYTPGQVTFNVGLPGFFYRLNDIFDVFDDDTALTATSGRIVSATSTTVTLDQPVTITGSSSKISVWLADGVTYETHAITNAPGTYTVLDISGTWSVTPTQYCVYGVTSATAPQQFRIIDLQYDNTTKIVSVTAEQYGNAYTYVEGGYTIPAPIYTLPSQAAPVAPTDLVVTPNQYIDVTTNTVAYGMNVTWTRPTTQNTAYILKWSKDSGPYITMPQFAINSFDLTNTLNGTYTFLVYSVNIAGNVSAPAEVSYTQDNTGGGTSATLAEITDLYVTGTTGTTWTGTDLGVTWTNPAANQGLLKDFVVSFSNGATLLREVTVAGVAGGAAQDFVYTYAMNSADTSGSPVRAITVLVQGQDSNNDTTTGITAVMTNPPPAVPSNITAQPAIQSVILTWTPETDVDVAGYMAWLSTTTGFTPSSANGIDCGNTAIASFNNLAKDTEYYYIVAAYDVFGKSLAGTGMNLSSQLSFNTPSNVGIASGSTLPTSGMTAGDSFYDTTNSTLYTYNGTAWVSVGYSYGTTLPGTGTTNQMFYDTATSVLETWNGSAWEPAIDGGSLVIGSVTTNQIMAGAITTALIAAGAITTSTLAVGAVTAATIASGTITTTQIAAGTIAASNIAAGTITGSNIAATTITGGNIAANTITVTEMAANSITTTQIVAGTILGTDIAASTISATNLNVSSLSAITANIGTCTAGLIENSAGTVKFDVTDGLIVMNNGTTMSITGDGFGASSEFIQWSGPTQSSASNYAACTTSNATAYLTTSGASYFGGNVNMEVSGITGLTGFIKYPPSANGTVIIEQWGTYTQSSSSPDVVTFTTEGGIAFPNNCMNVQITPYEAEENYWVGTLTKTGFTLGFGAGGQTVMWRAIGY